MTYTCTCSVHWTVKPQINQLDCTKYTFANNAAEGVSSFERNEDSHNSFRGKCCNMQFKQNNSDSILSSMQIKETQCHLSHKQQNQQSDCAPSEDSAQPGHPPSLIRVFAVRMKKAWVLSYPLSAQRRL